MQEQPADKRGTRLQDMIGDIFTQVGAELPASVLNATVEALAKLPHPAADEVSKIVVTSLEAAGEGATHAAELAGEITESIVEAVANVDLNV